jgi:hypothetical protein
MEDAATDGGHNCFVSPIRHQIISDCSNHAEVLDTLHQSATITTPSPSQNNARQ